MAVRTGVRVIATTRDREHWPRLEKLGAERCEIAFFGSFVFGTPGSPLSDVPLQQIAADAAAGRLDVKPTRIFRFEEIREAHRVMEAGEARGKMVVVHS